ncbi:MAG: hypothetical protein H8D87_14390 [Deltaproteobacteria bacterium]|uniref:hypothetical protein n=1 Tax=Desulfobacula sp. TaxID=2593537 RepID=UPI0019857234|nr:hypothetical protein [Candidatus Desulfobacula maris]MBL6993636.1 hypothetical protein [Desulfobacula sp.]
MVFTTLSNAEEEIEDLIDIFESNSKLVAIIEGKKTISFDLPANEKVLWSDSKGNLGAFLTNNRVFVISTSSGIWKYLHLRSDEPEEAKTSLSPNIVLLVFGDRAIGYDASLNQFIETQLPLHDELLAVETGKYVAVVITSSRAFGLAEKSSSFTEVRLGIREALEDVKVTSNKVTLRSSDRLLSFTTISSAWNEHRL